MNAPLKSTYLGIDPGEFEHAFVLLTPAPAQRWAVVKAWMVRAAPVLHEEALLEARRQPGYVLRAVGIERAAGFIHAKFRGPHLLVMQDHGGDIGGIAYTMRLRVEKFSSEEWKGALLTQKLAATRRPKGQKAPKKLKDDARLRLVLPAFVNDCETAFATNEHMFDAGACAVFTADRVRREAA